MVAALPELADVWWERARFRFEQLKDAAGALEDCDRALEIDPQDPYARSFRPSILLRLDRTDEALHAADVALSSRVDDPQALFVRGFLRFRRGELAASEEDLRRFLRIAPDHPHADMVRDLLRGN